MANVVIDDINLTNIANAIRNKNGLSTTYTPSEMATAITTLPIGGGSGELKTAILNMGGNGLSSTYTFDLEGYIPAADTPFLLTFSVSYNNTSLAALNTYYLYFDGSTISYLGSDRQPPGSTNTYYKNFIDNTNWTKTDYVLTLNGNTSVYVLGNSSGTAICRCLLVWAE